MMGIDLIEICMIWSDFWREKGFKKEFVILFLILIREYSMHNILNTYICVYVCLRQTSNVKRC